MTISDLLKMAESSMKEQKTLWEKEKLLAMSNFSFSHSIFERPVWQTGENQGLFWKGLKTKIVNFIVKISNVYGIDEFTYVALFYGKG